MDEHAMEMALERATERVKTATTQIQDLVAALDSDEFKGLTVDQQLAVTKRLATIMRTLTE